MKDYSQSAQDPSLSPSVLKQIDQVCNRFEDSWRQGLSPCIEDHLTEVRHSARPALLRELLAVEIVYRRRNQENVEPDDYLARFADLSNLVEEVFAQRSPEFDLAKSDTQTPDDCCNDTTQLDRMKQAAARAESGDNPKRIGRYEIEEEIGCGGMGKVFRGRDPAFHRSLALKVMLAHHQERRGLCKRFMEEAQVMGQLQHPGIPPVHDLGRLDDGRPYFSMKLIRGQTLAKRLSERQGASADLPSLVHIFEQVCQTLAFAHSRGIIHRDLKPANIMVGAFGEVQVMDWGLAKRLKDEGGRMNNERMKDEGGRMNNERMKDEGGRMNNERMKDEGGRMKKRSESDSDSSFIVHPSSFRNPSSFQTMAGSVMGTPAYMAPEQARGEVELLDERCDVFGLGAILCEILTGQPPFPGDSNIESHRRAMQADLEEAFQKLEQSDADAELVQLAKKCLAAKSDDRPASAGDVADAVVRYQELVQQRLKDAELQRATAEGRTIEERKRRLAGFRFLSIIACLLMLTVIGAGAAALIFHHQRDVIDTEKTRAVKAEHDERNKRWEGLLVQARAVRLSGRVGRRFQSLKAVQEAAQIKPAIAVRNEAIAAMALLDVELVESVSVGIHEDPSQFVFDKPFEKFARINEDGSLSVQQIAGGRELARWRGHGKCSRPLRFSPDGKYIAFSEQRCGKPPRTMIWHWQQKRIVLAAENSRFLDFHPESKTAAFYQAHAVNICDLPSTKTLTKLPFGWRTDFAWFDPKGNRLAITNPRMNRLELWDLQTERKIRSISPEAATALAWWPSGNLLAANNQSHSIVLLEPAKSRRFYFHGHRGVPGNIRFHPKDHLMFSTSHYDRTTRVWDVQGQEEILCMGGELHDLHKGGRFFSQYQGEKVELYKLTASDTFRRRFRQKKVRMSYFGAAIHWPSDAIALNGLNTAEIWDTERLQSRTWMPIGNTKGVAINPAGDKLFTYGAAGCYEWPIEFKQQAQSNKPEHRVFRVGPPRRLKMPIPLNYSFVVSRDLQTFAGAKNGNITVFHRTVGRSVVLPGSGDCWFPALSSDGRWLATGFRKKANVAVWDTHTGQVVRNLPGGEYARCVFSPDGKQLVLATRSSVRIFETESWSARAVAKIQGLLYPLLSFSPDGTMLAVATRKNKLQLLRTDTGAELATLEATPAPNKLVANPLFSADGATLVVPDDKALMVWDLRKIRARLRSMELDWNLPPYSPKKLKRDLPIRWEVDIGELAGAMNRLYAVNLLQTPGKLKEALVYANKAVQEGPRVAKNWHVRGWVYKQLDEYGKMADDYEKYLELKPANAQDYRMMAWVLIRNDKYSSILGRRALEWARKAIEIDGADTSSMVLLAAAMYRNGNWKEAHTILEKTIPKESAPEFVYRAIFLTLTNLRSKHFPEARRWFEVARSCIDKDRGRYQILDNLFLEAARGIGESSELDFRLNKADRAVSQYGKYYQHFTRANVLFRSQRYPMAVTEYTRALKVKSDYVPALHWRGHAYEEMKHYDKAVQDFKSAAKLQNTDHHPHDCIAWLYTVGPSNMRDAEKALESAQRAVQLSSAKLGSVNTTLGIACARAGQFEKAVRILENIVDESTSREERNRRPFRYLFLALSCHKLKRSKEAENYLQRADDLWRLLSSAEVSLQDHFRRCRAEVAAMVDDEGK